MHLSDALRKAGEILDEAPNEFEEKPRSTCVGVIQVLKMEHRFLGRYTCPDCGREVLLSDKPKIA